MYLKSIELSGFKSFGKKSELVFTSSITSIVGPNGSGKSNVAEGFRFVLGEQSMKSMRSRKGEDLIWGGSSALARANRASIKVTFDNSSRLLDIDFKEVVLERIVYRDGQNEYLLNDSQVRLKDVIRLLAGANIGGSGYQIISQGEADRILNATPKERREMVEDALGLKLYQHKKAESEKKLEETGFNIEKTKSLRRELSPHLNFLRIQVEKIEKARELKEELAVKMNDYLAREHAWISQEDSRLLDEARDYDEEVRRISARIAEAHTTQGIDTQSVVAEIQHKIHSLEEKLAQARRESENISRSLGRAEGALEVSNVAPEQSVSPVRIRHFITEIEEHIERAEKEDDISMVRSVLVEIRSRVKSFAKSIAVTTPATNQGAEDHVRSLANALEREQKNEEDTAREIERLRAELSKAREATFTVERDMVSLESLLREARGKSASVQSMRSNIAAARARFEEEVREGIALIGALIHGWQRAEIPPGALSEDRSVQNKRQREIERLKIKIEESGIGNGEAIMQEFKSTKERDEFLARELLDLEKSALSLRGIISDLESTIDSRFTEGLRHINSALQNFFTKLFGGGEAKLTVEKPSNSPRSNLGENGDEIEETPESDALYAGLSISVSLPRKKVRGLEALSGGERALTSIAMIFSMSQVNPPPFLILDETDAALDEANSKRYADMIKELGTKSQLIVITHNRATMAAAGELYGVTMGSDGVSKLLSVKFEEAAKVAK